MSSSNAEESPSADRILVLNALPPTLQPIRLLLEKNRYHLITADWLDNIGAILDSSHPDLVMLDTRGMVWSGDFLRRFEYLFGKRRHLPVIVLGGGQDLEDKVLAFHAGAVDYISKPFEGQEVLARVQMHLRMSRLRLSLEQSTAALEQTAEQLQRSNNELLQSDFRYRLLAQALPDSFFRLDSAGICVDYVPRQPAAEWQEWFQIGAPLIQTAPREIADLLLQGADHVFSARKMMILELESPSVNGEKVVLEVRLQLTEKNLVIGVIRDTTVERRMQEQIVLEKQEWQATFDSLSDALFLLDRDNRVLRMNLAASRLLKRTYQQVVGQSIEQLLNISEPLHSGRQQFQDWDSWFDISIYPFQGEEKNIEQVVFVKDVTEHMKIEAELVSSQKMAGLGVLAAGVAHEINSPLQIITGVADGLFARIGKEEIPHEEVLRKLKAISGNAWRVADIVHSLLTYARVSEGTFQMINLNVLITDTLLLMEHQLLSWSSVKIETDLQEPLPEISCDRNKMAQVLINLISNARDAMPGGGKILIRTCLDEKRHSILLSVKDQGMGIPDEVKAHIFEPFYTTKPRDHGTGLGLPIVYGIVQAHGGEIQIESQVNRGTEFIISLPLDGAPRVIATEPWQDGRYL